MDCKNKIPKKIKRLFWDVIKEEIIKIIKKSKGVSRKTAYFWSYYFNIPKEEIECLKKPYQKNLKPF